MVDFTELADAAALRCAAENVRDPERSAEALRGLDRLEARVAELEAALADERAVRKARLAALEWLLSKRLHVMQTGIDVLGDRQEADEFYSHLSAAVGAQVGPREGEQ